LIAIDTNVLVRLLVDDEPAQHEAARRFVRNRLSAAEPGYLSLLVLAETYWTLARTYKFGAEAVKTALLAVLDSEQVSVERLDLVRLALADPTVDFADHLIHLIGKDAGCLATITFDKRFAGMAGVELLN
jgi:predicted nucleic-acid-binding protein